MIHLLKKRVILLSNGCMLWDGPRTKAGYATIGWGKKTVYVHRLSYEFFIGKVPASKCVCHKCDNPRCVNPKHLFLGTHRQNMKDMITKKRFARGERMPNHKLKDVDRMKIIRLYGTKKFTQTQLAKRFGVAQSQISAAWLKRYEIFGIQ